MRNQGADDGADLDGDRGWTRRRVLAGLGALGVAPALRAACGDDDGDEDDPPFTGQPNFLVIVADDMRYDWLEQTPNVRKLIAKEGRSFTQGRCNVPLCQPSRVGMMTGQLSKHNGVIDIGFGGIGFDTEKLVSSWLADAGYRVGLVGKFINGFDGHGGIDAPPGFTMWREILGGEANPSDGYNFQVREESKVSDHSDLYETDYLTQETLAFVEGGSGPWACFVTPTEPHAPSNPRTDLADRFEDVDWEVIDEEDVSDKPPWIQEQEPLTKIDKEIIRRNVRGAFRELAAVDDMVADIIGALDKETLRRTVIIFTSDNGIHCGEHRRRGAAIKGGPYEVGLRVPLIVRGPGFEPGPDVTVPSLVFQDIVATMVDRGRATAGLPNQGGVSLSSLLAESDEHRQRVLLHEIADGFPASGDGITTGPDHELGFRKLYRYPSVRSGDTTPPVYEAYDLDTDPDEMQSWADDESRREERDRLEAILDELLA